MSPRSPTTGLAFDQMKPFEDGRTYALGPYFPKRSLKRCDSCWTQIIAEFKTHGWHAEFMTQYLAMHLTSLTDQRTCYAVSCIGGAFTRKVLTDAVRLILRPNIVIGNLLEVHHKPHRQCSLTTRRERIENARGMFTSVPASMHVLKRLGFCHLVLVDDIVTSGATFHEAVKTCRDAGWTNSITCLALARTVKEAR